MDLFTQIKMAVSVKEAAEYYGLEVNRGSMVCCPFHADRTPSMKLNEDYFYCFGCGASGDVIDLTAQLFRLSPADAARKLAADFGIAEQKPSVLAKLKRGKTQVESDRHCFGVLWEYFGILQDWKDHCAPQSPEDPIDSRYVEACHMLDRIGNMLDILISSNLERLIYKISGEDARKDTDLMTELKTKGSYAITGEMKANLADFAAGYATEEQVAKTIHDIYEDTGYVMDTHTAVAATVYKAYREDSKDDRKTVIASTASPYKFAGSVMSAIDPKYKGQDDFKLIEELQKVSGTELPNAIKEIMNAEIRHNTECDVDQMEQTVKNILGVK